MKNIIVSTLIATCGRSRPWEHLRLRGSAGRIGVASLAIAIVLLASKADAANILANPGFESGSTAWTVFTPQGYGGNVFEPQNPTHGGGNVYKNWGCWCSPTNDQSVYQDKQAIPGNVYTAGGFLRNGNGGTPGDTIGGDNEAWLQVAFLDVGGNTLELYQSEHINSASTPAVWISGDVTNRVDPVTGAILGTVSSLVAPAGTKTVRFTALLQQRNGGGGAVHFDDMMLDQTAGGLPLAISNLSPNGTALFNPAANGITFTASSGIANINASDIKLIINGLDVSSSLAISPGGSAASQSVTYFGLSADRQYLANINVTDEGGLLVSSTINFDTFSLTNFVWEAEDYDFDANQFFNNPTNTSYVAANSYFGRPGTADVDFHESGGWGGDNNQAYREPASFGPGVQWANDLTRQKFVDAKILDPDVHDFNVGWVSGLDGDWMNYKRTVPAGSYNLYCRLASGDAGNKRCQVGVVTSGQGTASQTVNTLGVATIVGGAGWQAWQWAPLTDAGGNLIKIDYPTATTVTYRVSLDGANANFFMLAAARGDLPLIANLYPTGTKAFEPANTLSFTVSSTVANIATGDIHVTLNGNNVDALLTIGSNQTNRTVELPYLASNAVYSAAIVVKDSAGTIVSRAINFDTFSESNFTFEAEDYNFGSGQYIANPVLSTTPGANNYYNLIASLSIAAELGVDISTNPPASSYGFAYLRPDAVGTEVTSDYLRQAYVTARVSDPGVNDYNVGWDTSGTWFNYTRDFPAGNYWIYGRLAGNVTLSATMDLVTGATTSSQTTSALGSFSSTRPANGWQSWGWVPLLQPGGMPAVFSGGTKTVRFTTSGNVNHNYFMLAPAKNIVALGASAVGGHKVTIPTQAGCTYTLYYKNSLTDANWIYLTIVAGDGTTKTYTDTSATGNQRFYRAVIQ
jgi:hypothetical protein